MSSPARFVLPFALLAASLAGCSTESFTVRVARAPRIDLVSLRRVAVDDFEGREGDALAEELTAALTTAVHPVTGQRTFEVVDRRNFDAVLSELKRQRGDAWNEENIARVGKLSPAAALIVGRVTEYDYQESVERRNWEDQDKKRHTTFTRNGAARVAAYVQVARTETGVILDSGNYTQTMTDSTSAVDSQPPKIDRGRLLDAARRAVVGQFLRAVAPYSEEVTVSLFVDGDFPGLALGNGYAKLGDWARALEEYRKVLDLAVGEFAEYRYKPLFNMGVALEYMDRFDEAKKHLRDAYALYQATMIETEIRRVERREKDRKQLGGSAGAADAS